MADKSYHGLTDEEWENARLRRDMRQNKILNSRGAVKLPKFMYSLTKTFISLNFCFLPAMLYPTAKIRDYLDKQGVLVCIPDKVNAKVKHNFDKELYKKRNVVERFFCRLKDYLRITIRLDKLSSSFNSFVCFAIFLLTQRIHQ